MTRFVSYIELLHSWILDTAKPVLSLVKRMSTAQNTTIAYQR